MEKINLKIVCEDEKYMPKYANETDACLDLKNVGRQVIFPNETCVCSSGIKVAIPDGYVMLMFVRSSIGIKHGCTLANGTGIIDAGYRDEIKIALRNNSKSEVVLSDGDRIAQFMVIPRPFVNLIKVEDNEDFRNGDRGGGIGSTGV